MNPQSVNSNHSVDHDETVVLVHGIWMLGVETQLLARRLRQSGYRVRLFRYQSVYGTLEHNENGLRRFIEETPGSTVHFVAHSMGGLLTHHFLEQFPHDRPGRVVALGSPFNGSWTAQRLQQLGLERVALGRTLMPLLARGKTRWSDSHSLGVMAGTNPLGVGRVLGTMPGPNDGTVTVAETEIDGAADHRCVPVNHFGLLISRHVFEQTVRFLREGRF